MKSLCTKKKNVLWAVRCEVVILCLLEVEGGESDLVALQRGSHEDHRSHRGHHVVGRDMFLTETEDDEGGWIENRENRARKGEGGLFIVKR